MIQGPGGHSKPSIRVDLVLEGAFNALGIFCGSDIWQKVSLTPFLMILWKLHMPANIDLKSMFYTSNKKDNNNLLADELNFRIFF